MSAKMILSAGKEMDVSPEAQAVRDKYIPQYLGFLFAIDHANSVEEAEQISQSAICFIDAELGKANEPCLQYELNSMRHYVLGALPRRVQQLSREETAATESSEEIVQPHRFLQWFLGSVAGPDGRDQVLGAFCDGYSGWVDELGKKEADKEAFWHVARSLYPVWCLRMEQSPRFRMAKNVAVLSLIGFGFCLGWLALAYAYASIIGGPAKWPVGFVGGGLTLLLTAIHEKNKGDKKP